MVYYKKSYGKYVGAVLCLVMLLVYTLFQMSKTVSRIEHSTEIMVEQNAKAFSQTVEARIGYAESNIRVIVHNIGMSMNSPELRQPHFVLNSYLDESPFSFIEYVRADGINTLADGRKLDAKDRVYYKEGMKGKSGIWANYKPALSKEVLLNHYTPLYYGDQLVGVVTGVIGGDTGLRSILRGDFWGQICYNILCDGKGRIITSNFSGNLGLNLEQFLRDKGFEKKDIDVISQNVEKNAFSTFRLEQRDSYGLVSLAKVGNHDFYVLQIVPSSSIDAIKNHNLVTYYGILGALLLLLMLICLLYRTDSQMQKAVLNAQKELDISTAISKMYYSLHIIDLSSDTAEDHLSSEDLRKLISQKEKASEKLIFAMENLSKPEWTERAISFVDLSTLQERMQDQEYIMLDFEGVHFWVHSFFTVMQRDEDGKVAKVIFVTRIIDKYMKDMQKLHRKANVDQLTGLLNRTSYEADIKGYKDTVLPDNFVLASIDVNALKTVNDNIGHAAGDELIQGAAECMKRCLGGYGHVYRTGGDEFTAILFADEAKLEEIKKDLEVSVRVWHGNLVPELNLACGYASKAEYPEADLKQLNDIADKQMYADKELYYSKKGLDRRRQQYVFDVISSTYTKILRVNLSDDTYSIVRLFGNETEDKDRPAKISSWLESFGNSKRMHPEDRAKFLKATKLEAMRAFFRSKRNHYSLYYRRELGGEFKYVMMEIMAATDYSEKQEIVYMMVKELGSTNI